MTTNEAVSILHDDSGRLLVVPGNVTVYDVAKTNQCLVKELEKLKQIDSTDKIGLIKQGAHILRADIIRMAVDPAPPGGILATMIS